MDDKIEKSILWFEDQQQYFNVHIQELKSIYKEVLVTASRNIIESPRDKDFDLILLDIMIHTVENDEKTKNLKFSNTKWHTTGLEFMKRIRSGVYFDYGIPSDIPIIVVTAVVQNGILEQINHNKPYTIIEKPLSVKKLLHAVCEVFQC